MRRLIFLTAAFILPTIIVVVGAVALLGHERFEQPGPLRDAAVVIVPRGAGLEAIAHQLQDAGVITDALIFEWGARFEGRARALKAGEYSFPAAVSMRGAMELLESGQTLSHPFTFPEGLTSAELVALLNQAEGLSGTVTEVPPEGSLLPETYHFTREDPRAQILARMRAARDDALAELWPKRTEGLPLKTPEEAVILASIIEEETGQASEREVIASVFINRLNRGMKLQSDPTVIYGLTNGNGPLGRALTFKDLEADHPYNTYLIDALPPGPITNPGRASLEAVLNPAETDLLYFVADGTGGHAFAKTLDEHNRNVAKWRQIQKQNKAAN